MQRDYQTVKTLSLPHNRYKILTLKYVNLRFRQTNNQVYFILSIATKN